MMTRPEILRARWEDGQLVRAEDFRAEQEGAEAHFKWAMAALGVGGGAHGVLPPSSEGPGFEVDAGVNGSTLWVRVNRLDAVTRDGTALAVRPEQPLSLEQRADDLGLTSVADVFVLPDRVWVSADSDRLERRRLRLELVAPEFDGGRSARLGLKVARFRRGAERWKPVENFLPCVFSVDAMPHFEAQRAAMIESVGRLISDLFSPHLEVAEPRSRPEPAVGFALLDDAPAEAPAPVPNRRTSVATASPARLRVAEWAHAFVARARRPGLSPFELLHEVDAFAGAVHLVLGREPPRIRTIGADLDDWTKPIAEAIQLIESVAVLARGVES